MKKLEKISLDKYDKYVIDGNSNICGGGGPTEVFDFNTHVGPTGPVPYDKEPDYDFCED